MTTGARADSTAPADENARPSTRRRLRPTLTGVLAGVLVWGLLVAPNQFGRFTPAAFARLPIEAVLGATALVLLRGRTRRVAGWVLGIALGLLTVLKMFDLGFFTALGRQFDPVLDWVLVVDGTYFVRSALGRAGEIGALVLAVALVVAILLLAVASVRRLSRVAERHRPVAIRMVAALAVGWLVCALVGVQAVPGARLASFGATRLVYERVRLARTDLHDKAAFAAAAGVDPYRNTPGDALLTGLRGKQVVFTFVESYGRSAVEDPGLAPPVDAVLAAGDRRLAAAGFSSRSAFLTSPTSGGGSWLAHSTLLSGLWIDNQQRYRTLVASNRLTLNGAFRRAGWRTVGIMPGITSDWPEGRFFSLDRVYDSRQLGYRGPAFSWATMPDQYTLAQYHRLEQTTGNGPSVMAEIPLVSSHAPWSPLPRMVPWDDLGDGSVFDEMAGKDYPPQAILTRDPGRVRADYRQSIAYSLDSLISYVETYGDDDLVLVFLGDHQPSPVVTGPNASRDVPITIVAHDPAVLDRISGWDWDQGLRPSPQAPVWRMDTFRDRFLTAFGG